MSPQAPKAKERELIERRPAPGRGAIDVRGHEGDPVCWDMGLAAYWGRVGFVLRGARLWGFRRKR